MGKRGPKPNPELRDRIVDSTYRLICARGPNTVTIDQIAADACVGRQTIYRLWPTKTAVVLEALELQVSSSNPVPDSGSSYADIRTQMNRVAAQLRAPFGAIIRELVAEAQGNEEAADEFRVRFFAERRRAAAAVINRGIERGELRENLEVEAAIDMLYAPLWLRFLIGHLPLDASDVDQLLDQAWPALSMPVATSTGLGPI